MQDWGAKVIWFSKERYLPGDEQAVHKHSFFHYIYVLSGKACISVGDQSFEAQENDFYMTPVGVSHSLKEIHAKGFNVIEVKFIISDPELCSLVMAFNGKYSLSNKRIRYILENLISEGMNKESFYVEMVNLKFLEVLYYLLRSIDGSLPIKYQSQDSVESFSETMHGISDFDEVLSFIDANLAEPINLDQLSKISKMSKHHFCRHFKEVFGISPIQYLNKKRLSKAKQYMLHSDMNITQIAGNVGFPDIPYFSKFFKKHVNVTPQEFVKKVKPNLYFQFEKFENKK